MKLGCGLRNIKSYEKNLNTSLKGNHLKTLKQISKKVEVGYTAFAFLKT